MAVTRAHREFLLYWRPEQARRDIESGIPLNHAASEQFRRVKPGDVLWMVTAPEGRLRLVGRMEVARITDQRTAERLVGPDLWEASHHALPSGSGEPMVDIPLESFAEKLTFKSADRPRLTVEDGLVTERVNESETESIRI